MKNIFKKIITYILRIESKIVLLKYKPKIIAITGSVGKTSTKDAIFATLSGVAYVRKSEKSFNSEIGLPLTILGCSNAWNNPLMWLKNILKGFWLIVGRHKYPEWLILEVGIGKPGDMKKTALWLKTDVVVITAIGETPSHIEFFHSRKHLVEEKAGLIKTLKKDGLLILNNDDETVINMKGKDKHKTITYGFKEGANILGSGDNIFYDNEGLPKGIIYRVDDEGKSFPVIIEGVFGKNHVYSSLCAIAVFCGLKLNILTAIERLKNYDVPPGRMRLLKGMNNSLIIDDTYNSSPHACETGLITLGEIVTKNRKIAILGDMLELGKHTKSAHENIGKIVSKYANILFTVGPRADDIKNGAIETGMNPENIFSFLNSHEAGEFLKNFIKDGDIVFVKGSQGMRMEHIVESILEDQANKSKLLVRQETEWKLKI